MDQINQPEEKFQAIQKKIKKRYQQIEKELEYIKLINKQQIEAIDTKLDQNQLQQIQSDLLIASEIFDNLITHYKIIKIRQNLIPEQKIQQSRDIENQQQVIQFEQPLCNKHQESFIGIDLRDDIQDDNILFCDKCNQQEKDKILNLEKVKELLQNYLECDKISQIKQISLRFYDLYLKKYQIFAQLIEKEIMSDYAEEQLFLLQSKNTLYKEIIDKNFVQKIKQIQKKLETPNFLEQIHKRLTKNMDALMKTTDNKNIIYRTTMKYEWKITNKDIDDQIFQGIIFNSNTNIMITAQITDVQNQLNISSAGIKFSKLNDNQNDLYNDYEIIKVCTSGYCSCSSIKHQDIQEQEIQEQIQSFQKEQVGDKGLYEIKFYLIKISKKNYLLIQYQTQLMKMEIMKNKQITSLQVQVYLSGFEQLAKIDTNLFRFYHIQYFYIMNLKLYANQIIYYNR